MRRVKGSTFKGENIFFMAPSLTNLFLIISIKPWKMFLMFLVYIWYKHWINRIMICRLRLCAVVFVEDN